VTAPARPPPAAGKPRRRWRRRLVRGALLLLLAAFAFWLSYTGPRDPGSYPPAASSPYRLPWPGGVSHWCTQGNHSLFSHRDRQEYAYDFAMPTGSDVCAARGGVVVKVEVVHDGNGYHRPNNFVAVAHGDDTYGWYLHLRQGGSHVREGDVVRQGQLIASSGNVGHSTMPHLHFAVTDAEGQSLPVTFADVPTGRGIPREPRRYTSGNAPP
jgi:murein DD-endopeptidase MepM/ murein hydrolase activator NlpD